jgi:hypothetical protein
MTMRSRFVLSHKSVRKTHRRDCGRTGLSTNPQSCRGLDAARYMKTAISSAAPCIQCGGHQYAVNG